MKKTLSLLLTLLMMAGVIALAPVTASAVIIGINDAAGLALALTAAADGDTIKLLDDIDYDDQIVINGKSIIFDLNGFTLEATAALTVTNGELLLADPDNGEFNVSYDADYSTTVVVDNGKAEVTNVSATGTDVIAVKAINASEIVVYGDVTMTDTDSVYIQVGTMDLAPEDYETPSTKAGYLEYTDDTSYVWVKCQDHEWGAGWDKDANGHKHSGECELCGAADTAAAHTYGAWVVDAEAAAGVAGSKHRTCSVCAYVDTQVIPALDFDYVGGPFGCFKTKYIATMENWIKFYLLFGWVWMWFVPPAA